MFIVSVKFKGVGCVLKIETLTMGTAFLLLVISPAVFGQDVEISIPASSGAPGSTVTIPVNIGDTTGREIIAVELILQYNPEVLSAIDADTSGAIAQGWQVAFNKETPGQVSISMIGMESLNGSGTLVNVRFSVQPTALFGSTYQLRFTKARLNEGTPFAVAYDGIFTVEYVPVGDRMAGDVNGDNHVDYLDLLKLILVYGRNSGDSGYDPAADLNGDGRIDKDDMIVLWENFGATRG